MKMHRIFKLALLLIITGLCFALDAGLGLLGSTITLALVGAAGEPEPEPANPNKETVDAISSGVKAAMQPLIDEWKKVAAEAKKNPVGEDLKKVLLHENKGYQTSAFLSAVRTKNTELLNELKAITAPGTEGTSGDGGILVPTLTDNSIKELVPTYGQILKHANVMPMTGNTRTLPLLGTRITGAWYAENAQIIPEKQTFSSLSLAPKKWAGMLPVSNELLQDASPDIGDYLLKTLAIAEGYALDGAAFSATTSPFNGLYYASNSFGNSETITGTDPTGVTYKNLVTTALALDPAYLINAKWYLSHSMLAAVLNLTDLNGKPIFDYNTMMLLGRPVVIVPQAPTSAISASKVCILFGDLGNAYVGDVAGRRIKMYDQASVTINGSLVSPAEFDFTTVSLIKRYAFDFIDAALSVAKTAAS